MKQAVKLLFLLTLFPVPVLADQDIKRLLNARDGEGYDYVLFLDGGRQDRSDEWISLDAPAVPPPPRLVKPYKWKGLDNELFALGFTRGKTEKGHDTIVFQSDEVYDDEAERLTVNGEKLLNRLSFILRQYDLSEVLVEVHTDSLGTVRENTQRSAEVANSFSRALREILKIGVRVTPVARGEGNPVATNNQAIGRFKNRRIELILLKEISS